MKSDIKNLGIWLFKCCNPIVRKLSIIRLWWILMTFDSNSIASSKTSKFSVLILVRCHCWPSWWSIETWGRDTLMESPVSADFSSPTVSLCWLDKKKSSNSGATKSATCCFAGKRPQRLKIFSVLLAMNGRACNKSLTSKNKRKQLAS